MSWGGSEKNLGLNSNQFGEHKTCQFVCYFIREAVQNDNKFSVYIAVPTTV